MVFVRRVSLGLLAVAVWTVAAWAQDGATGSSGEALEWLKKIADSSRAVSYGGIFVFQRGNRVETSRVVHYVNAAGGVFEKLETLDGPPREVVRANDHVTAYLPDARVVLVERRSTRHMPVLLPEKLTDLTQTYDVKKHETARISGFECVWISVMPRDALRYGRKFCAELSSGLPLRAQVFGDKAQVIESFGFSQLTLGGQFNREQVTSRYEARARAQRWRVDQSALNVSEQAADTGWALANPPAGFKKSMEVRRTIAGRTAAMPHLVYSDGLAAISIFVEPRTREAGGKPLMSQGAVHIYKRVIGDSAVTVLGEVPAATVMQIGNAMEPRMAQQNPMQQIAPHK